MKYWSHSHNSAFGCTKCSPGCSRCWALAAAQRMAKNDATRHLVEGTIDEHGGWTGRVRIHPDRLQMDQLVNVRHERPVVAVCWMTDLFHEDVPDHFALAQVLEADRVARVRWAKGKPAITFLFLTKRYDRCVTIGRQAAAQTPSGRLEGIWWGASCCTSDELRRATSAYLHLPGIHWLSFEPLLGYLEQLDTETRNAQSLFPERLWHWAVLGGQSNGAKLREDHARVVRDWCISTDTPLLFKQWGGGPAVKMAHDERGAPLLDGSVFLDLPFGAFLERVPGKGWVWR